MKHRLLAVALGLGLAATVLLTPAFAVSDGAKFMSIYNTVNNAYQSLQNVASAHNSFAASHHGNCSAAQIHKWWESKYRRDSSAVKAAESRLGSISRNGRRHGRTYHDFVESFKDLGGWMSGRLKPRLLTCRHMPTVSRPFNTDLQNLQNDLGIINY